jgi:hypothetical protein
MAWTCYTCGTKNSNSADTCKSCGGNTAAPSSFYISWVFGGTVIFLIMYLSGTLIGGTLIEVAAAPTDAKVLAEAKANGATAKSILTLDADLKKKAKAAVIAKAKAQLSGVLKNVLYWFLPFILFFIGGAVMGFMSDGKTIVEAGIGQAIGQIGGFLIHNYVFDSGISWIALIIGLVVGAVLAVVGAWVGEILQDRRERATA